MIPDTQGSFESYISPVIFSAKFSWDWEKKVLHYPLGDLQRSKFIERKLFSLKKRKNMLNLRSNKKAWSKSQELEKCPSSSESKRSLFYLRVVHKWRHSIFDIFWHPLPPSTCLFSTKALVKSSQNPWYPSP